MVGDSSHVTTPKNAMNASDELIGAERRRDKRAWSHLLALVGERYHAGRTRWAGDRGGKPRSTKPERKR
jgi:hypothetical protein